MFFKGCTLVRGKRCPVCFLESSLSGRTQSWGNGQFFFAGKHGTSPYYFCAAIHDSGGYVCLIFGRWGKDRLYESSLSWSREKPIDPMMDAMERCWTLADAGLQIKKLRSRAWNLRSRSVFCRTGLFIQPDK